MLESPGPFIFVFTEKKKALDKRNEYYAFQKALESEAELCRKRGEIADYGRYRALFAQCKGWECALHGGPDPYIEHQLIFQPKSSRPDIISLSNQLEAQLSAHALHSQPVDVTPTARHGMEGFLDSFLDPDSKR